MTLAERIRRIGVQAIGHGGLSQEDAEALDTAIRCVTLVQDIAEKGGSFDANPTLHVGHLTLQSLSAFYVEYLGRVDEFIRRRAREALKP